MSGTQETEDQAAAETFCESYQAAVELVGKRWNGAILAVLMDGARRYSSLAQAVPGLSERLLSERLKELEAVGVVTRRIIAGPPIGVEYELTDAGRDLRPAIDAIAAWARRWVESGRLKLRAATGPCSSGRATGTAS